MDRTGLEFILVVLLITAIGIPALGSISDPVSGSITRASGEEMIINVTVEFDGILDMVIDFDIQILKISINSTLMTADDIRENFSISPSETEAAVEGKLWDRAITLAENSFQGDTFDVISGQFVASTLDEGTADPGSPVTYSMLVNGTKDIKRYLDQEIIDQLEEGREDHFITSQFMCGFEYQRTVTLLAEEGELLNYRIPTSFDPIGDGTVELDVVSPTSGRDGDDYFIQINGMSGYTETYFSFNILDPDPIVPVEEIITGQVLLDWKDLETIGVQAEASIDSVSTSRSTLLEEAPSSITVPTIIPASLIRYAHLEGIVQESDLGEISDQLATEVQDTLIDALSDPDVRVDVEIDTSIDGMSKPGSGAQLSSLLNSDDPVIANITTSEEAQLDILEDHDEEDVMGLLNGGLKVYHDLDPFNDDRFTVKVRAPRYVILTGETAVSTDGDRKTYDFVPGRKLIGSSLAPNIAGEMLSISGMIDISEIRSVYVADMEIDIEAKITFGLGAMKFDSEEVDITTEIDYELEYLTSDMIRLLMDMGLVDREEIEEKIEEDFTDSLNDILPDDEDSVIIDLVDESLDFDGDRKNMTGDDEILLTIEVSGTMKPLEGSSDDDDEENLENGILPFHMDPILPVTKIERDIELKEAANWDFDMEITIPSGIGLKAWLVKDDSKIRELEVDNSDGHPTIHLDMRPGEADHIKFEVKVGSYLLVNNIGACFGCCILSIVVIVVIILLIIFKIAKKRKGKKEEDQEEGDEGKEKKKDGKKKAKGKKKMDPDEKELSWDK
jgi:hypothetical protein